MTSRSDPRPLTWAPTMFRPPPGARCVGQGELESYLAAVEVARARLQELACQGRADPLDARLAPPRQPGTIFAVASD